jgi:hypothetical protein
MQLQITESRQFGDGKVQILSSILNVLLTLFLMTFLFLIIFSTFFFNWFVEGSGLILLLNFALVSLTLVSLYFLRRTYNKIIFADHHLILCSRLKLLNRKIKYSEILKILIDEKTDKRRIETMNEYFEIDNADKVSLTSISQEKHINLKRINVA